MKKVVEAANEREKGDQICLRKDIFVPDLKGFCVELKEVNSDPQFRQCRSLLKELQRVNSETNHIDRILIIVPD